jgi:dipeptidyl aminopeptidase/acylaminoacyl peptidase
LLQGASDPRVPKEEAQQAYDSLKAAGRTVELHIYAQEGHGFLKRENRTDALTRIVQWF